MPRSSRSKSHKQSKHSSREYTDFDEDVKMKERNDNSDGKKNGVSVKDSKDSLASGEKRKLGKDLDGSHANGSVSEEYATPSKRRKDKIHGGSDRWNGDVGEEKSEVVNVDDKKLKSKDLVKVVGESKSKTSRKHDVDSASVVVVEKDGSKSGSGSRSEKRSDKESGRKEGRQIKENKETKDKDRGSERERKIHDSKREVEAVPTQVDNQPSKRGREHNEWPIEEELRNIELEKELEKRMRRREGYSDKDRYQDDVKDDDERILSTKSGHAKDSDDERILSTKSGHAKDSKHKDEVYGDKFREGSNRETRPKEDKCRNDGDPVSKSRDVKYRGENGKGSKHKDDKYREDGEKVRREDKYHEDGNRDVRNKDRKNHDDGDRDSRRRDEKHREGGGRVEKNRDDKHMQDDNRDYRHKEERYREDGDRDHRHKNSRPRDDTDREKRVRDPKHRDVHASRAHSSEVDTKNMKDDMDADLSHGQKNKRSGSPIYDDRVARHKDDKDRRIDNDKDERSMNDAKVDPTPERGRPSSRNDMEITGNHSRHRSSPSNKFYPTRDHHRISKQEETKYRDSVHEERACHNVNSNRYFTSAPGQSDKISSRSLEKITQKDDNFIDDLSVERHRRSDARSSPLVDSSPSSASNGRRHLNRLDVRRNLDVDELGQRSSGSKDAKEYSDKDGKVNHKLVMEVHPDNDLSHVDGDNWSVSSPYVRSGPFSGNHKSLLPLQPLYRTGSDSPLGFGSSEDDRSKSNGRHRRSGDSNMGRPQSNWKNVPNWPSPLTNGGYIPFQHIPPPIFNPAMQQFVPPIFGRPPMQVNHAGMPYHVPDGDRFSGHGHPLWRNQLEESIPPPIHSWETNNAVFGDGSHGYGRLDWDHGRTQLNNQMWESSADLWKGQDSHKIDHSVNRPTDEFWSGPTGQHVENEHSQPDNIQEVATNNIPEIMKASEIPRISVVAKEDDPLIPQVYLSKIDISEDLTQPELYDQCTNMLALDQASVSDEFDCKILFLEAKEGIEADISNGASLFAAIDDSVFEKAMSLYTKHKVPFVSINQEGVSVSSSDQEKGGPDNSGKLVEEAVEEENELLIQKVDMKEDKSDEQISTSEKMDMEVDGGCEIEVKDSSGNKVDNLLVLTNNVSMPELIESGLVNLSRIHDESTH
ncbi:uncharacterized protein DDB_G0283697-like [Cynara cardunculus var. scolymus]|uniref:uncharacterized protein DDB_G0283697-like n=1 Tax=Cynara cardunculus var. scolymus TaxID=59895 RepID=UPI000D628DF5|nr:uncharacterized protein DDB_G0283697-like [Cynara cardunculus var. scolymus]